MTGPDFQDKRIAITGGLGFIGSNLAHELVRRGAQVRLVDSLDPGHGGNLTNILGIRDRVRVKVSDIRDKAMLEEMVKECDYLFNLAGQTSHLASMTDPFTDLDINVRAQLAILEAVRLHNPELPIVFASTRQIYGRPAYLPVDEKHPVHPVDVNGINKLAGEWYHRLYHDVHGIPTRSLRLTNTYGPRMRIADARQTFVGVWIRKVIEGREFEVWGGDQKRDFTYVDDVVEAMLLAATTEAAIGKVFNVGGPDVVSLKHLADLLLSLDGGRGGYVVKPYPADRELIDIGDFFADDRLIRETLGFTPRVGLKVGLERTLEYFRGRMAQYVLDLRDEPDPTV